MPKKVPTHGDLPIESDQWVDLYGDYLYRFALGVVHDPTTAEELVQETFVGALQFATKFKGRSSERNWLTALF